MRTHHLPFSRWSGRCQRPLKVAVKPGPNATSWRWRAASHDSSLTRFFTDGQGWRPHGRLLLARGRLRRGCGKTQPLKLPLSTHGGQSMHCCRGERAAFQGQEPCRQDERLAADGVMLWRLADSRTKASHFCDRGAADAVSRVEPSLPVPGPRSSDSLGMEFSALRASRCRAMICWPSKPPHLARNKNKCLAPAEQVTENK